MRFATLCLAAALAGCSGAALDTATLDANRKVVLTELAAVNCDAQKAANTAGVVGQATGNAQAVAAAAAASIAFGSLCVWENPPVAVKPAG